MSYPIVSVVAILTLLSAGLGESIRLEKNQGEDGFCLIINGFSIFRLTKLDELAISNYQQFVRA